MFTQSLSSAKEILHQTGWCFFRDAESASHILATSEKFGTPVCQVGSSSVDVLEPRRTTSARPNTTSSHYGLDVFPVHTDMAHWPLPPRYLVMRAVLACPEVPTLLTDSRDLRLDEDTELLWQRTLWRASKIRRPFLCSMFFDYEGKRGIRWDEDTMVPYGKVAVDLRHQISTIFRDLLSTSSISIRWESSDDILVVDNWRMLHARPQVPTKALSRKLERVLVKAK